MTSDRANYNGKQQTEHFHRVADTMNDSLDHDMLHAAGRVIEIMPRYALGSEAEYVARWLDALWERFVKGTTS